MKTRIVGRSWSGARLGYGLDGPLELRGGDDRCRDLPERLPVDWLAGFADVLAEARSARLSDGRDWFGIPPLALVGAGSGLDVHLASLLAVHAGLPLAIVDLDGGGAGLGSGEDVRGPEIVLPSNVVLTMAGSRCANPIVLVRGAEAANGSALIALTAMMDPRTAPRWTEEALGGTVDLSQITWLVSVERIDLLPLPLSRLLRPLEIGSVLSGRDEELLMLGMFAEAAATLGAPRSRCAAAWPRVAEMRVADWAELRAVIFEGLRA